MVASSKQSPESLVNNLANSKKALTAGVPLETITDIIESELKNQKNIREAESASRRKLHNLVAPWLDELDYVQAAGLIPADFPEDLASRREFCTTILNGHASTKERIPILDRFYQTLFEVTGAPHSILDLACGLNPFSIPWMNLPEDIQYHAYDIHQARIDLINRFLAALHMPALAEHRDILVHPPEIEADVAFFFKEAHRFEQRKKGCNRPFFRAIRARWLLVSLPATSLSGKHRLADGWRNFMQAQISGEPWQLQEVEFKTEIVFCIRKG